MEKASRKKRQQDSYVESILNGKSLISSNISSKWSLFHKPLVHFFLIAIVGLLIYSNTFDAPFHFDDKANIIKNNSLKDLNNFWPPSGSRWFGFLTFALNYKLGGLNTYGYHIINLTIHIINAILIYFLVFLTFKTPYFKVSVISASVSNHPNQFNRPTFKPLSYLPLFIALIFISHPVQTQAVTYIVQRFTSLATFFYLLSLIAYIKSRLSILHTTRYTLYAVSFFSAVLAMKTKEISFTLPVIITLYEFMFFDGKVKRRILYLIPLFLTIFIIPLTLIGANKSIGDIISDVSETTKVQTALSREDYLLSQFRVIVTYIRLLFLPINQNLDYDYPIYSSFSDPNVFLSFLFLLSLFGLGVYLLYRSRFKIQGLTSVDSSQSLDLQLETCNLKLISFGILWFFITLSVESSFIPIVDVIFEHRLYLSDIGAIIAFVSGIFYILRFTIHASRPFYLLLATVVIIFSVATYKRNIVWQTPVNLWEDTTQKSPNKERPHENLGVAYSEQNRINEAIKEFETAVQLDPASAESHYDLGNAYQSQGRIAEAVRELETALNLSPNNPNFAYAYYSLGMYYSAQGRLEDAIIKFQGVLRFNPYSSYAHNGLGNIYLKQGRINDAIREFETARRLSQF